MLEVGIKGTLQQLVDESMTAACVGSGTYEVLATPSMIMLIEKCAWLSVSGQLKEGYGTVGTLVQVEHLAATPVGKLVTATTELIKIENRKLSFTAEVSDESGVIGRGTHERVIVESQKFLAKAAER